MLIFKLIAVGFVAYVCSWGLLKLSLNSRHIVDIIIRDYISDTIYSIICLATLILPVTIVLLCCIFTYPLNLYVLSVFIAVAVCEVKFILKELAYLWRK